MLSVIVGRRRQGKSTLALALAKSEGSTVIVFDPNNQYGAIPQIESLSEWMKTSTPQSIGRIVPTDPAREWEEIAQELDGGVWMWGEYVLILDECSMLMSPHKINPSLERFARTSPKDVKLILTTHRTTDVHPLFRALATDWYVFQQHLDRDLDTLADNFGSEFATATTELGQYQLAHFWLAVGGEPEYAIWKDPGAWYIDIGRIT